MAKRRQKSTRSAGGLGGVCCARPFPNPPNRLPLRQGEGGGHWRWRWGSSDRLERGLQDRTGQEGSLQTAQTSLPLTMAASCSVVHRCRLAVHNHPRRRGPAVGHAIVNLITTVFTETKLHVHVRGPVRWPPGCFLLDEQICPPLPNPSLARTDPGVPAPRRTGAKLDDPSYFIPSGSSPFITTVFPAHLHSRFTFAHIFLPRPGVLCLALEIPRSLQLPFALYSITVSKRPSGQLSPP